jgi:hypothetical protein
MAMAALLTSVWHGGDLLGAAQDAKAQQARGQEAVGKACVQCHALRPVTLQRKTAEGWRDTVHGMIGRGAQVMPDEIEPMVAYLAASFGPESASQPGAGSSRAASATGALPDGAGRAVITQRCAPCHDLEVVTKTRQSRTQWVATLQKMKSLGAMLSAEEEKVVTSYLAEHLAPPSR